MMGTGINFDSFYVAVYDRWGNIVFESNDFSNMNENGWDGSLANGTNLSSGSYAYTVKAKYHTGQDVKLSGTVTFFP